MWWLRKSLNWVRGRCHLGRSQIRRIVKSDMGHDEYLVQHLFSLPVRYAWVYWSSTGFSINFNSGNRVVSRRIRLLLLCSFRNWCILFGNSTRLGLSVNFCPTENFYTKILKYYLCSSYEKMRWINLPSSPCCPRGASANSQMARCKQSRPSNPNLNIYDVITRWLIVANILLTW